ncbi:MAG: phage tail tape measure protein [Pseudomonadota bacterium]
MDTIEPIKIPVEADLSGFSNALGDLQAQSKKFGTTFAGTIRSAIVSGKSFEDTLRSIALKLSDMALSAGLKPLENLTSNLINGLTGAIGSSLSGFTSGGGSVTAFAKGGVVSTPTYFPMGGAAGLMGEAGAEAILPLSRGSDGNLGVRVQGNSSPANIVFNVTSPDVQGFRKSQNQISAMLARTVGRGRRSL